MEEPWIVESFSTSGIVIHNSQLTKRKIRHVDDVKPFISKPNSTVLSIPQSTVHTENEILTRRFTMPKEHESIDIFNNDNVEIQPMGNNDLFIPGSDENIHVEDLIPNSNETIPVHVHDSITSQGNSNDIRPRRKRASTFDTIYKDYSK